MTAVIIQLPNGAAVADAANKVTLIAAGPAPVTLPITDPKVNFNELAPNWVEVPKPGLIEPPFLVRGPRPLRSLTLTVTLVNDGNMLASIEPLLSALYTILQSDRITLAYANYEASLAMSTGGFVCTSYQPTVTMRDPGTNQAIQATATITLKEANTPPSAAGVNRPS